MVFMLFYYRGSGVNAVVALLLNMILMLAALIVFGATLTLARYRRHHPDHRHGGRFERADL